jgi:hypothetical protein
MPVLVNNKLERIEWESVNTEFQKLHTYKPGGTEKTQQHFVTVSYWPHINSWPPEYEKYPQSQKGPKHPAL